MISRILLALPILFGAYLAGAQGRIDVRLDNNEILIGDQVTWTLRVSVDAGAALEGVDISPIQEHQQVEVIEASSLDEVPTQGPEKLYRQSVRLTAFDSGFYVVPPVRVNFRLGGESRTLFSDSLGLMVRTIPLTNDTTELQPIKDIIREPFSFSEALPYVLGAVVAALVGAFAYWLWRRRRRDVREEPEAPPVPAHEKALTALRQLKQEHLLARGQIKTYHIRLSAVFREYLEDRFGIPALEYTSPEVLRSLQQVLEVHDDWIPKLQSYLTTADLVKFAKAEPPEAFHLESWTLIKAFVDETAERPQSDENAPEAEPKN